MKSSCLRAALTVRQKEKEEPVIPKTGCAVFIHVHIQNGGHLRVTSLSCVTERLRCSPNTQKTLLWPLTFSPSWENSCKRRRKRSLSGWWLTDCPHVSKLNGLKRISNANDFSYFCLCHPADTHIQTAAWDGSWTVFGHRRRRVSPHGRSGLICVHRLPGVSFKNPSSTRSFPPPFWCLICQNRHPGRDCFDFLFPRSASSMHHMPNGIPAYLYISYNLGKQGLYCWTIEIIFGCMSNPRAYSVLKIDF